MLGFLAGVPGKLAAIYSHLTTHLSSARAAKIDALDAAVSSRAPGSTALSTDVWTAARAARLDEIGATSIIKSIQHIQGGGVAQSGSGYDAKYADVTIAAVNTAKSFLIVQPYISGYSTGYGQSATYVHARFINSTTVRVATSDAAGSPVAFFTVVEFL